MIHSDIMKLVEDLVSEGEISNAISYLKGNTTNMPDLQKELILLSSRLTQVDKKHLHGTITDGKYFVERNKISERLLTLLSENKGRKHDVHNESVIDRAKRLKDEEEFAIKIRKFKSSIRGIIDTEEVVKRLFDSLPAKVTTFSTQTGLNLEFSNNPRSEFESNINFEEKGGITLVWRRRYANDLKESNLLIRVMDRRVVFNQTVPSRHYEPKLVSQMKFEPTLNESMEISWMESKGKYLENDDIVRKVFDLIVGRLEKLKTP